MENKSFLCLCQPRLTEGIMFLQDCPFITELGEHNVLKTNELIWMQIGTSSPQGSGMKRSTWGLGGQESRS